MQLLFKILKRTSERNKYGNKRGANQRKDFNIITEWLRWAMKNSWLWFKKRVEVLERKPELSLDINVRDRKVQNESKYMGEYDRERNR